MHIFQDIIDQIADGKSSFVVYRNPSEDQLMGYSGMTTHEIKGDGFVFAPFSSVDHPLIFFPALSAKKWIFSKETKIEFDLDPSVLKESGYGHLDFASYQKNFKKAFALLQNTNEEGHFVDKIVLSHRERQAYPLSISAFFSQLLENFPKAFVYMIYTPESGFWMGASPELLLATDGNNLKTVALAGTKAQQEFTDWSEKEIKEQALVSIFIEQTLKESGLSSIEQSLPYTFSYGHLLHLKTDFSALMNSDFSLIKFLKKIHPTPAICGFPQKETLDFLREIETHRSYYTGYLGFISEHKTQLFVNLRCASLWRDALFLYAGGGLTIDSVLEKEWEEIQLKLTNLKRFL